MRTKTRRLVIGSAATVFVLLYLITWSFGVPAIHNEIAAKVIFAWERKLEGTVVDPKPIKPRCHFGPDFVVFPGVIVSRTDWQASCTGAAWGWAVYIWYGRGAKCVWFRGAMA